MTNIETMIFLSNLYGSHIYGLFPHSKPLRKSMESGFLIYKSTQKYNCDFDWFKNYKYNPVCTNVV